jgi:hypothetical protein
MSKVRIGHEDVFIPHVTNSDPIPEKYHFNFNHLWIANSSDTKRIAVRKIKAYPMNVTAEIGFAINDPDGNPQNTTFHYALIGNQPITDLLIYIVSEINKFIDILYPNTFPSTLSYYSTDYNNGTSIVTLTSLLLLNIIQLLSLLVILLSFLTSDKTTPVNITPLQSNISNSI